MTAVVEEEDMPVIQVCGVVLVGNCARSPLPTEVPGVLVDDTYRVGKLTSKSPSEVTLSEFWWVHSSRFSSWQMMSSSGFK